MKKKYKKRFIIVLVAVLSVATLILIWGLQRYTIVISKHQICTVGIIDSDLTSISDSYLDSNLIVTRNTTFKDGNPTHGDRMIEFLTLLNPKVKVYYYNAESKSDGEIDSDSVLEGLKWLRDNNVSLVNVSLSSKMYSKEMNDWLDANRKSIMVFASYNNRINTLDFPAGYESTVGSGFDDRIKWGKNDIKYTSNEILLLPSFRKFKGNSYLSLISLMEGRHFGDN